MPAVAGRPVVENSSRNAVFSIEILMEKIELVVVEN